VGKPSAAMVLVGLAAASCAGGAEDTHLCSGGTNGGTTVNGVCLRTRNLATDAVRPGRRASQAGVNSRAG
jgi:hypothetical protein